MDNAPRPNVDPYGFEWPADFDHEKYGEFMSKYITILSRRARKWDQLLNSKEGFHKSNKVKRYIRKGIPSSHRGAMWMNASGAKQLKEENPDLYKIILKEPWKPEVIETINLDIPRTFPDNIYFKTASSDSKRNSLYQVLAAFAYQNPQIGYCQGLNFIAGIMLLVTDSEETTFWLLQSLVENILPDYYTKQMTGLLTDISVLEELVRNKVPQVHNHMVNMGVSWSMYVSKWFVCLFMEVLPIETVLRIWDCLFYEGSKVLLRVAVTLVMKNEAKILAANNFVEITEVFKALPNGALVTDCHSFLQAIFRTPGSFPRANISRLREYCRKRIEKEQEETKILHEKQKVKDAAERQARQEALQAQKEKAEQEAAAEKARIEAENEAEAVPDNEGGDDDSEAITEQKAIVNEQTPLEKHITEESSPNESKSSMSPTVSGLVKAVVETAPVNEHIIEPPNDSYGDTNEKKDEPVIQITSVAMEPTLANGTSPILACESNGTPPCPVNNGETCS